MRAKLEDPCRVAALVQLKISSVTGNDVDLPLAGPGGRAYAFVIDWHIRLLLALSWLLLAFLVLRGAGLFGVRSEPDANIFIFFAGLPAVIIYFLYHPVLEWKMGGETPGKRMAGIRIVTRSGARPSAGAILIRNVFRLVDSLPVAYCAGFVATMLTRDHVRIGDLAAGTVLVYASALRVGEAESSTLPDQAGSDADFVELVSNVLERWPELAPDVRDQLARRLLARAGQTAEATAEADLRVALASLLERR